MQSDHYTLNWKEARFELLKKNKNRRLESNPETFFLFPIISTFTPTFLFSLTELFLHKYIRKRKKQNGWDVWRKKGAAQRETH